VIILGLADGQDAGAAVVVDDRLVSAVEQERLDRVPHTRGFPWEAAELALAEAGLTPADVDQVAVAGRFSPAFFLRRHPELRRLARDSFSPLHDVQVFYQAVLRQSGLGALEADRAAEWLEGRLRERGYRPRRTKLVDIHRALAEAAHRCQPHDPVLVVTLNPRGDGVALAAYRGSIGQLDCLWMQKGFASMHVHLHRCLAAMGLDPLDDGLAWALAADAEPDVDLQAHLDRLLYADGPRLSRRRYPFPERRSDYLRLASVPTPVAAATLQANLARAVCGVIRYHARKAGMRRVAVGGGVFENPWLVRRVAQLDEIDEVWTSPLQGWASLALGAACSVGGLAPGEIDGPGLGISVGDEVAAPDLDGTVVEPASTEAVVALLREGAAVARCSGRGGFGRHGGGTRSVLCLATEEAVAAARRHLSRTEGEAPVVATATGPADPTVAGPLRWGAVVADTPLGRRPMQRVDERDDPELLAVLRALGPDRPVALFPLGIGREPAVERPDDAVDVFRRAGLEALWLGPHLVRR